MEKFEESMAHEEKLDKLALKKPKTSKQKMFKTPRMKEDSVKGGMKVGLTSPNSGQVVAMGTIQKAEKDYVEMLVNLVFKESTLLPHAQGRMTTMGSAQSRAIQWPLHSLKSASSSSTMSQVEVTSTPPAATKEESTKKKRAKSSAASKCESSVMLSNSCV